MGVATFTGQPIEMSFLFWTLRRRFRRYYKVRIPIHARLAPNLAGWPLFRCNALLRRGRSLSGAIGRSAPPIGFVDVKRLFEQSGTKAKRTLER